MNSKLDPCKSVEFFNNSDHDLMIAAAFSFGDFENLKNKNPIERRFSEVHGENPQYIKSSDGFDLFDAWVAFIMTILDIKKILTFDREFADIWGFTIDPKLIPPEGQGIKKTRKGKITENSLQEYLTKIEEKLLK